ncbi:MAG: MBL fold metallo-hydrolase [Bacteroidota bacterium]|nr:MBL fold metallo-hydrolase [Bacteroidota bacterium]
METNNGTKNILMPKKYFKVANGIWGMKILFVNIYMVRTSPDSWVLIDAGLTKSAGRIIKMAEALFGVNKPPTAIVLTHGHFDHTGALVELLKTWDVPVYAHRLEIPYLTGRSSYPPADPTVGGGLMSYTSFMFPITPIDIKKNVNGLDERADNRLPFMPGWRFVPTPGHSPGHISLFDEKHHVLIAGDAFVTTKSESAISVARQTKVVSGPPKYFTYDWVASKNSVQKLLMLEPKVAATGHGVPMQGLKLTRQLRHLVDAFEQEAVPSFGRYVPEPARVNAQGVQYVPGFSFGIKAATAFVTITLAAAAVMLIKKRRQSLLDRAMGLIF